ncbi:Uncharacterized protein SCF082_LOCUS20909, partial [Durusdinium trenchii]
AKVNELVQVDPDAPMAPNHRVQQRGVQAAVAMLQQTLQGITVPTGAKVNVFDLTPNRFAEWSRAVWDRQLSQLKAPDSAAVSFTYTGYFTDMDEVEQQRKTMH